MNLNETNFGKIVVELNNFTHLINPETIADFEKMSDAELASAAEQKSFFGEVARWYQFLLKSMRVISAPDENEPNQVIFEDEVEPVLEGQQEMEIETE